MRLMPLRPCMSAEKSASAPKPKGETAPRPVITTRLNGMILPR